MQLCFTLLPHIPFHIAFLFIRYDVIISFDSLYCLKESSLVCPEQSIVPVLCIPVLITSQFCTLSNLLMSCLNYLIFCLILIFHHGSSILFPDLLLTPCSRLATTFAPAINNLLDSLVWLGIKFVKSKSYPPSALHLASSSYMMNLTGILCMHAYFPHRQLPLLPHSFRLSFFPSTFRPLFLSSCIFRSNVSFYFIDLYIRQPSICFNCSGLVG